MTLWMLKIGFMFYGAMVILGGVILLFFGETYNGWFAIIGGSLYLFMSYGLRKAILAHEKTVQDKDSGDG